MITEDRIWTVTIDNSLPSQFDFITFFERYRRIDDLTAFIVQYSENESITHDMRIYLFFEFSITYENLQKLFPNSEIQSGFDYIGMHRRKRTVTLYTKKELTYYGYKN